MSLQICMLDGDFTANMVGLRPEIWGLISGHLRNRFIGGTYHIIRPIFQAYVREYPHNSYGLKHMVRLRTYINWILKISHWNDKKKRWLKHQIRMDWSAFYQWKLPCHKSGKRLSHAHRSNSAAHTAKTQPRTQIQLSHAHRSNSATHTDLTPSRTQIQLICAHKTDSAIHTHRPEPHTSQ